MTMELTQTLRWKCQKCDKTRGNHRARTLECPTGMKTRIGQVGFSQTDFYEPKVPTKAQLKEFAENPPFVL